MHLSHTVLKAVQLFTPYLLFATTTSYLFMLTLMYMVPTMTYPYGADLVPLNSSFDRVKNVVPQQCNGLWDCYTRSCNLFQVPAVNYVAIREHYENPICNLSFTNVLNQTSHWSLLNASKQLMIAAILIELFSAGLLLIRLLWQSFEINPRKSMIISWNIGFSCAFLAGPLMLLTIIILLNIFYNKLVEMKGQDVPSWINSWLIIPGASLLVTLFVSCGHLLLLVFQRDDDYYEPLA